MAEPTKRREGKGVRREASPPQPPASQVFGNYRCDHPSVSFPGRPCNKWLFAGTGPRTLRCPRCKREREFREPNDPIR